MVMMLWRRIKEVKMGISITLSCYARSGKALLSRDLMEITE